MKIYTKRGDKGKTSLLSGEKVDKSNLRINAYGSVDELNSFIGLLEAGDIHQEHKEFLTNIQNKLFNIGSRLAQKGNDKLKIPKITEDDISLIEKKIDDMNTKLDPLKVFIIPGGNIQTAYSHVCRSVCRRAEREIVLLASKEKIDEIIIQFVNRLSDYFFVLARMISKETGIKEKSCKY
jgi:cob(I)alamin adenosyltransferase